MPYKKSRSKSRSPRMRNPTSIRDCVTACRRSRSKVQCITKCVSSLRRSRSPKRRVSKRRVSKRRSGSPSKRQSEYRKFVSQCMKDPQIKRMEARDRIRECAKRWNVSQGRDAMTSRSRSRSQSGSHSSPAPRQYGSGFVSAYRPLDSAPAFAKIATRSSGISDTASYMSGSESIQSDNIFA